MSTQRPRNIPNLPTLPQGTQIAAYKTYADAQKAVDYLSDNQFPVQNVTIVGGDLKMVERVTGRLSYGKVALAGLASGAWFGLFVGIILMLFSSGAGGNVVLSAIALGAGFGMLFSVISHSFTRGKRDFTSTSQIVASHYAILCAPGEALRAQNMLSQLTGVVPLHRGASAPHTPPHTPAQMTPPVAAQPAQRPENPPVSNAPAENPPGSSTEPGNAEPDSAEQPNFEQDDQK